ncbi:MAG: acyl-CoA thioesterase/BAAT N-terminal domain-containing protein [Henriciella sp.]|nr:acyl-CoA thioesterase/BAAT N-terminal domain-containing protein [Henriciella sp.]
MAAESPTFIVVEEERGWFDPNPIFVEGIPACAEVAIEATFEDAEGQVWSSKGVYHAGADGRVDVATSASFGGTYQGVHAHGLTWSALPLPLSELGATPDPASIGEDAPRTPSIRPMEPTTVKYRVFAITKFDPFEALINEVQQTVYTMAPGVVREEIDHGQVRGVLFRPESFDQPPAVLWISGSGGGVSDRSAALVASKGFAVLAIATFAYEGRPDALERIPLEYFRDGADYLRNRFKVDQVGIAGGSRGGETALLVAAIFPNRFGAVMASVPSNLINAGCCSPESYKYPAYTYDGRDLPVLTGMPDYSALDMSSIPELPETWRYDWQFQMDKAEDENLIPVERIKAPIMLISGDADLLWPSSVAANRIADRLKQSQFEHPITNLVYDGAGHFSGAMMPFSALTEVALHPVIKSRIPLGGFPRANAHANYDAFDEQIAFFRKNLKSSQLP